MLWLAGRSTQVTAEDVIRAIRRATRNAKDGLAGVVVRKLGEDVVYVYDRLNVDINGRTNRFSVFELYRTYLSSPKALYDDAARIDYVSQLYSREQGDVQASDIRTDWIRSVVWPKLNHDERLKLQAVADFILDKFYGFVWEPRRKSEYRYNLEAMNTLQALVWPLVEREKGWKRGYRTGCEPKSELTGLASTLGSDDEPYPAEELTPDKPDPGAAHLERLLHPDWSTKEPENKS